MSGTGRRVKSYLDEIDKYVIDLMLKGKSTSFIIQDLLDNWEVKTESSAKHFIRRCNAKLSEANKTAVEDKISQYKEMYLNLYEEAVDAGERKVAREIMDSIIKLEGLITNKIQATVETSGKIDLTNVTDEKLDELFNKLNK